MKLLFVVSLFYCFLHLVQGTCNSDKCSTTCNNDGYLFEFVSTKLNYYDAQAECLGSTRFGDDVTAIGLAIVETEAIKDELTDLESKKRAWIGAIATNVGGEWVYGFDIEDGFQEIQDGDEANGFWASGEPNGNGNQNCVQTNYKKGGQWDDAGCHVLKAYFCQYNCAVSVSTTTGSTSTQAVANIELISTTETPKGNFVHSSEDSSTKSPISNLIMDSSSETTITQKEVSSSTEAPKVIENNTTKASAADNQDTTEAPMMRKEASSIPEAPKVIVNGNNTKTRIADNQDSSNEAPKAFALPNSILEKGTSESPNTNSMKVSTTEAKKEVNSPSEAPKVIVDNTVPKAQLADNEDSTNEAPKSELPSAILQDSSTKSSLANLVTANTTETSITQKEVISTTEAPKVTMDGNTAKVHIADNQDSINEAPKATALSNTMSEDGTSKSPKTNSVTARTADNQDSLNDAQKSEFPSVSLEDLIIKSRKLINLVKANTPETSIGQTRESSTTETPRVIVDGSSAKASIANTEHSNFETPNGNTTEPPTADNDDSITEAPMVSVIVDSSATEALGAKEEGEIPRAAVKDSTTQVPKLFEAPNSTELPRAGSRATTEVPSVNDEATTSRYSRLRRSRRPWLNMVSN